MPVIVQTVTSTVTALWGKSYIRDANGKFRLLQMDEVVVRGDMILTEQNAIVQLSEDLKADAAPVANRVARVRLPEATDLDRTIAALDRGDAGVATAAGAAAADGGLTAATVVERVVEVAPGGLQPLQLPVVQPSFSAAAPVSVAPTVSVAPAITAQLNVQRVEGAEVTEGTALVFPVQLSAAGTQPVTLPFALVFNTADGKDVGTPIFSEGVVLNADGTITVPAGVAGFVVTVPTVDDKLLENSETITLTLGGVSATGQINDNDQPAITGVEPGQPGASGDAVQEGEPLVYTVSLAQASSTASLYPFSLGGGTGPGFADAADFGTPVFSNGVVLNADGTLTVPPGVTSFTVTVPTVDDSAAEASERLPLTVGGVTATGTIVDNDSSVPTVDNILPGPPGLLDDSAPEGAPLSYTVTLSKPTTEPSTFPFALGGGTAGAEDIGTPVFTGGVTLNADGTITVPAGLGAFTVTVPTAQDTVVEGNETVPLTIGGVTATSTIIDDDAGTPGVTSIEPGRMGLGDDATPEGAVLTYAVSLSGSTVAATTYPFQLGGGTATVGDFGDPVFSNGVTLNADGTITVPAGVNSFNVSVPTTQDTQIENNETVPLKVGDVTATGTIVDDDGGQPAVVTVEPGAPGLLDDAAPEGTALVYTVTLSAATPAAATYPFSLGGGTAAADDFAAPVFSNGVVLNADGTITVPAGVGSFSITVPTTQDTAVEADESLPISVGGVVATGTIIDDDGGKPDVVSIEPGNPGLADDATPEGADLVFAVTLSGATTAPSSYPFQLGSNAAGMAGSADFGAPVFSNGVVLNADGTITVPAGVSGFSVTVPTTQDTEIEANEQLPITIGGASAMGTIIDDDGGRPVVVSVEPGAPGVADNGTPEGSDLVFTVTLSGAAGTPTTHAFSLGGGTAAPEDLGPPSFSDGVVLNADGTITVPPGVTSFTVTVPTVQDSVVETDETVPLTVGGVGATGTIIDDDDGAPTVVGVEPGSPGVADDRVPEGNALAYTVTLSAPTTAPATYAFKLGGGTAGADDLGPPVFSNGVTLNADGSITVPAGVQTFSVTVPTTQDSLVEGDETVPLLVGGKTATGTIADDDGSPTITSIEPGLPGPEGNSAAEGSDLVYTVSLSSPTNAPATYPFTLGGGSAGAEDLGTPVFSDGVTLNPDGTITVPAGVAGFTVTVPTTPDTVTEADETVPLSIGGVTATGTIVDDDGGKPTVTRVEPGEPGVADNATPEGTNLVYTVSLSGTTSAPSVYAFNLGGGTAGAADFGAPVFSDGVTLNADGTLTVPAGVASFTVTVPTTQDSLVEANETLPLAVGGMSAVGSIIDDDGGKPSITTIEPGAPGLADDASPEGTALEYTVTLSATTSSPATYSFTLGGGTAGAADIGQPVFSNGVTLNADGTITVPAGVAGFTVTVPTVQDTLVEADETVPLTIGGTSAMASIIDDDGGKPTVITVEPGMPGVGDNSTPEGSALVYTVTLSAATTGSASYAFDMAGGTASAADLGTPVFSNGVTLAADGTLNVPAGVSSFTITVPTVQDTLVEPDETVTLSVGGTMATGTIIDDDGAQPPITTIEPGQPGVGDDKVTEGGTLAYTVTLGSPTSAPATYSFTLGGGTAGAGDVGAPVFSDGVTLNPDGTITVPAGVGSFTVSVPTTQDTDVEPDETLPLTIGGVSATAIIADDDKPGITSIEPGQPGADGDKVVEGESLAYTVTLGSTTAAPVSYAFTLGGSTAGADDFGTPTFTNGVTLNADGTITVPAGVSSFTVNVPTTQDSVSEPNEELPLSIGGVTATATIVDDDGQPPITSIEPGLPGADDDTVTEGSTLAYTVTLGSPTTAPATYTFTLGGGTADAGDVGTPVFSDGVTLNPDGTITVPAGVGSFTVSVPTTQDTVVEPDETLALTIDGVTATAVIVDDDAPPSIQSVTTDLGAGEVTEGGTLGYTVTLSGPSATSTVFAFQIGGGTAQVGDFGAPVFSDGVTLLATGGVLVPAGVTSFTVKVPTFQDQLIEPSETVTLSIGGVRAEGTILDDDGGGPGTPPGVVSVEPGGPGTSDDRTPEGDNIVYTVTLSGTTTAPTSLSFALGGGTASNDDLGTPSFTNGVSLNADGSLNVPAGVSSFRVVVPTTQDSIDEADETVPLSVGGVTGTGTLVDDDKPPTITGIEPGNPGAGDDAVLEGTSLVYTVSLSNPSSNAAVFAFSLGGGTASADDIGSPVFSDGVTLNADGSISVPAGVTRFTVTVPTVEDNTTEANETLPLRIGDMTAVGTIVDNDPAPPTITGIEPGKPGAGDNSVVEGSTLAFTVTLSGPSSTPTSFPFTLGGGSAGAADIGTPVFSDGVVLNADGTITVPAGISSFTAYVPTLQDTLGEPDETVPISIGGVGAVGIITDDDGTPGISTVTPETGKDSVTEGQSLVFSVSLTNGAELPTSYSFSLGGGTAGAGDIGTPVFSDGVVLNDNGTITVPAGVTRFTVTVPTEQDKLQEADETVRVSVGGVVGTGTIVDDDFNQAPVVGKATGRVSEEGLTGGIKDTDGSPADTTDAKSTSGRITISDPEGQPLSAPVLTAPTTALTSGGVPVVWSGAGTGMLTASAGGATVATVQIDAEGNYSFTLLKPVDHAPGQGENQLQLDIGVQAGDGQATGSGTLSISIEDDAPVAADLTTVLTLPNAGVNSNIMVVLDVSGSMGEPSGIPGQTRLQAAVSSLKTVLDRYDELGDVAVRLVSFGTDGKALGDKWTSVAEAKSLLHTLQADGHTNYDDALGDAMAAFTAPGRIAGGQNVAYFMSDGAPTAGSGTTSTLSGAWNDGKVSSGDVSQSDRGVQAAEEKLWTDFLNANRIDARAVSMVNDPALLPALNPVAFNGVTQTNTTASTIANFADLTAALAPRTEATASGSLINNNLGADGGRVHSFTVDGVTYTYNEGANNGSGGVTASASGRSFSFEPATQTLQVDTAAGGRFTVDLDGGSYTYRTPADAKAGSSQDFGYALIDNDGDVSGATGKIQLASGNHAPVAVADVASIDTGTNFVANGGFEQFSGGTDRGSWIRDVTLNNWAVEIENGGGLPELVKQTSEGNFALDMEQRTLPTTPDGATRNLTISQNVDGLSTGQSYQLQFDAGRGAGQVDGSAKMDVYFGGKLVSTLEPGADYKTYSFTVTAGANAADNVLKFVERGAANTDGQPNNTGTYLDNVRLTQAAQTTGNVLTNDSDSDAGDKLTVVSVADADGKAAAGAPLVGEYGTLTLQANGSYTYVADPQATGALPAGQSAQDVFTYTVRDATGATASATLTVNVAAGNHAPVAVADVASIDTSTNFVANGGFEQFSGGTDRGSWIRDVTLKNWAVEIENGGGLPELVKQTSEGNFALDMEQRTLPTTADGATRNLTISQNVDGLSTGQSYQLQFDAGRGAGQVDGSAKMDVYFGGKLVSTLEPGADYKTYSFTVTAGANPADNVLKFVERGAANPDGQPNNTGTYLDNVRLTQAAQTSGNVLTNDSDSDAGDKLTVVSVADADGKAAAGAPLVGEYGTLTLQANGSYTYVADPQATGALPAGQSAQDVFTYTVRDSTGATASATLTVNVTGSDSGPPTVKTVEPGQPGTGDNSVTEGDSLVYTVDLSNPSASPTSYSFSLGGGSASASDIAAPVFSNGVKLNADGTIAVPAGVSRFTVTVASTQDSSVEGNETVPIRIGSVAATGTIVDDDTNSAPIAVADQNSVTVSNAGAVSPFYFVAADQSFGTVDPSSGARITLGHTSQVFFDVAVTPSGAVYGVAGTGGVYAINPATGATTLKADAPGMNALTADENGTLYGTTYDGQLYTVDPGTGVSALVGDFCARSAGDLVAVDGKVYMASSDGRLLEMDLATQQVSVAVSNLPGDLYSLGLQADGDLYAITAGGQVYALDPVAHTAQATGVTVAGAALLGMGSSAVPATATGQVSGDVTPGGSGQDHDPDGDSFQVTGVVAGTAPSAAGQVGQQISGTYGLLNLQADGSYTYTIDGSKPATQALTTGASASDVFSYTITDANGASATTTLTLNVTGSDSGPPTVKTVEPGQPGTGDNSVTEGDSLVYTVDLSNPSASPTSYSFSLGGGSASASDIAAPVFSNGVKLNADGTIAVPAGVSRFTVTVASTQDSSVEGNETVPIRIGSVAATGTIVDDDTNSAPIAVADQNSVTVSNAGAVSPFYFVAADQSFGTVDPSSGARITLGHTSQVFFDVAVTPSGAVYGVAGTGGVYAINPATGATTLKADAPGMNALTADENGTLYGTTYDGQLYTVDPGTGVSALVGDFCARSAGDLVAVDGKVYMASSDGRLLEMDLATQQVSVAVSNLPGDLYSLGLQADGDLYAITAGGQVYALDPVAHTAQATGVTVAGAALLGMGSSAVPATATGQVSGDVTPGGSGQDHDPDGDSFQVTGVVAGTAPSAAGQVGQQISGTYGLLNLQADGSYTYTIDGSKPATQALTTGASASDVFSYTITDAQGASATTTLTLNVTGGDSPVMQSGRISGDEDQCITLKWEHFGSGPVLTRGQSVSFSKLPADGELQVCENGCWRDVCADEQISKTAIDCGQLRFKPEANESGADALGRDGVGNGKNTYAVMDYAVHAANGQAAAHGSLDVDIKPVADCPPTLTCNLMSAHGAAIGAPAGHKDAETVLSDGTAAAAGTPGGYYGFWHNVCLQSCTLSPDTDGSEKAFYQLKVNQLDVATSPTIVALNDGTVLKPAADGSYWLPADQADKVWLFRQWGDGPNGKQYSHQSLTATSWNAELDANGHVVNQVQGNSITSSTNTPLVLDLDGNGIQTVDSKAGASFDYDGDGVREATGWVGGHDGLLVSDTNGDGRITSGKELFGDAVQLADGSRAADGYAALRELDANHDGVISAGDAGFSQLKVWVDANGDGLTQDGELLSLQQAGVASLNLQVQHSDQFDNGNHIALTSDYTRSDGSVHGMADVWFGAQRNEAAPATAAAGNGAEAAAPEAAAQAAHAWGQEVFAWDLGAPAEPGTQIFSAEAEAQGLDLRDLLGGNHDGAADALQTYLASAPLPAAAAAAAPTDAAQHAAGTAAPAAPQDSHTAELHAALSMGMGSSDDSALRDLLNRDKPDMGT